MANLKDIRRRITSVEKTQQITSAMRMVAAAKLRRAETAITAARPYAERMRSTLSEVAGALGDGGHPLLSTRDEVKTVEIVVITSDKGLAGAFNGNALKAADAAIEEREAAGQKVSITTIGRKANEHCKRRYADKVSQSQETGTSWIEYDSAGEIARRLSHRYENEDVDEVVLIVNDFISVMTQTARTSTLLPFSTGAKGDGDEGEDALPYSIEPSPEALLATLVPKAVEVEIFRALLENQAGEHAARMTAMENATRNTEDLIERLTLEYNRARQAAITTELVEIVSGAEAL